MANLKQRTNTQRTGHNVSLSRYISTTAYCPPKYSDNQIVKNLESNAKNHLKNYHNRAKSKAITDAITKRLVDVKGSKMIKYYWQAYHCNSILQQTGQSLVASYCNTRHCVNCNRIRTAKAINGYGEPLNKLKNKHFVTLTRQSVKGEDLESSISGMIAIFRNVLKNLKNTHGITLKGIRKLECNYNEKENTYNPHFHLLVSGNPCEILLLKSLWLKQYTTLQADPQAQDIKKANKNSQLELFKYMAKMVTKDGVNPNSLDTIFTAIKGKRTIQPFGGIKKVSEDVEDIQKQDVDFVTATAKPINWQWNSIFYDWVSEWGEVLTNYNPSSKTLAIIESINNPIYKPPQQKDNKKTLWLN